MKKKAKKKGTTRGRNTAGKALAGFRGRGIEGGFDGKERKGFPMDHTRPTTKSSLSYERKGASKKTKC